MEEKPAASEGSLATPSAPTESNLPTEPPKNSSVWSIIIVVLVLLIIGVSGYIAYQLGVRQKSIVPSAPTPIASPSAGPAVAQKRIVYSKDNVLYIINVDGTGKKKIISGAEVKTRDWSGAAAGVIASFDGVSWKNNDTISYLVCSRSCAIFSKNLSDNSEVKEVDNPGPGGPNQVSAFAWNHAGNKLAYIYNLNQPKENVRLDFKTGSETALVKTLAPSAGGRGGSLDDNVSIYFSPDDRHVVVTDTATQPNNTDKSTIWIFESGGKEVAHLVADPTWPTQARWADNNRVLYKKGDFILAYYLDSKTPGVKIASENSLENPVPYGQQIYYWVNTDGLPKLGIIGLEGYYHPEILDSTNLLVLKAKLLPEPIMVPFESAGLSVIDLTTNKASDLDTGGIYLFSVSP